MFTAYKDCSTAGSSFVLGCDRCWSQAIFRDRLELRLVLMLELGGDLELESVLWLR